MKSRKSMLPNSHHEEVNMLSESAEIEKQCIIVISASLPLKPMKRIKKKTAVAPYSP